MTKITVIRSIGPGQREQIRVHNCDMGDMEIERFMESCIIQQDGNTISFWPINLYEDIGEMSAKPRIWVCDGNQWKEGVFA